MKINASLLRIVVYATCALLIAPQTLLAAGLLFAARPDGVYSIDPITGGFTRIGGERSYLDSDVVYVDGVLYQVTGSNGPGGGGQGLNGVWRIDPVTQTTSQISLFGLGPNGGGITYGGGMLYAAATDGVYSINPITGGFTRIGGERSYLDSDVVYVDGVLYQVTGSNGPGGGGQGLNGVWRIDPVTQTTSQISLFGLGPNGGGITYGGGMLYAAATDGVYSVNPITGGFTRIGGERSYAVSDVTYADGVLYEVTGSNGPGGGGQGLNGVWRINPVTQTTSQISLFGLGPNGGGITYAAEAVVPLPPAVWLFGSALGLMGAVRRKVAA